jgi:hypothetical protein
LKWPPYYNTKKAQAQEVTILTVTAAGDAYYVFAQTASGELLKLHAQHSPKLGRRIVYRCEACQQYFLDKDYYLYKNGKRKKRTTMCIDHVDPVVDPTVGRTSWDAYIERMFFGAFQLLCRACHHNKSAEEGKTRGGSKKRGKSKEV